MAQSISTAAAAGTPSAAFATIARPTRALLACGVVAGPLFLVAGLAQALTRDGFDLTRHALSLLSNGHLGWIQIGNFLVSGLLTITCAVGMRRVLGRGPGGTWGPRLVGIFGTSLVCAGVFRADAADGFPPGTPPGPGQVRRVALSAALPASLVPSRATVPRWTLPAARSVKGGDQAAGQACRWRARNQAMVA